MGNSILILLFGLFLPCCLSLRYFYQTQQLTWEEAQKNCREHYTDLATFESQEDIDSLQRPAGLTGLAWIGLSEDRETWQKMGKASTSWRWSATGEHSQSGYSRWALLEPSNFAGEYCVVMDGLGFWLDIGCEDMKSSICFTGVAENTTYAFVSTKMNWSEAQAYCRQKYTDLVTIETDSVNAAVKAATPFLAGGWIGLYRIPFVWSDNTSSTFRKWEAGKPDYFFGVEQCVAENDLHEWDDKDCSSKKLSICYKPDWVTRKTTLRLTLSSAYNLSMPGVLQQIQQQLTDLVGVNQTDVETQLRLVPKKAEPEGPTHEPEGPNPPQCTLP